MARFHIVDHRHRHAFFGPSSRCLELGISVHGGDLALAVVGSVCHGCMHPGRYFAAIHGYRPGAMAALHCEILLLSPCRALLNVAGDPHVSDFSLLSRHAGWCILGRSVDIVSTSTLLIYNHVFFYFFYSAGSGPWQRPGVFNFKGWKLNCKLCSSRFEYSEGETRGRASSGWLPPPG